MVVSGSQLGLFAAFGMSKISSIIQNNRWQG